MWKGWARNSRLSHKFYNTIWFLNISPWLFILFILSDSTEIKTQRNIIGTPDRHIQEQTTPTIIGGLIDEIQHGSFSVNFPRTLYWKPFPILGFPWTHPASSEFCVLGYGFPSAGNSPSPIPLWTNPNHPLFSPNASTDSPAELWKQSFLSLPLYSIEWYFYYRQFHFICKYLPLSEDVFRQRILRCCVL